MVSIKALEAAITQISDLSRHEYVFEAGGTTIALRPLRAHEEIEIQRYAATAWSDDDTDEATQYQMFLDHVRLWSLGFSIIQIGELDLRGTEYLETGEETEDGKPVSMPKHEAVAEIIQKSWTKQLTMQVFSKFGELLNRIETATDKLIEYHPAELEEEIDRVSSRLESLIKLKEERKEGEKSPVTEQQKLVDDAGKRSMASQKNLADNLNDKISDRAAQMREGVDTAVEPEKSTVAPEAAPEAPAGGRQSSIPQQGAPPKRELAFEDAPQEEQQAPPTTDQQGIENPYDGDSFFDPSDPEQAIAAEARRQAQLHARNMQRQREQKMERQRAEAMGMPTQQEMAQQQRQAQQRAQAPQGAVNLDAKTQGLRQAANLQNQTFNSQGGQERVGRPQRTQPQAVQKGPAKLHGKPVYKMPTQTLDKSSSGADGGAVNPEAGGRQSKFVGPTE
jgi:hypothetical protein